MNKELELWRFVAQGLRRGERVMLLIVADSSGSSPGRAGYKMAVARSGELSGSIGGGVMEMRLVEEAKSLLSEPPASAGGSTPPHNGVDLKARAIEQVHRSNVPDASGMICSGRQSVIMVRLDAADLATIEQISQNLAARQAIWLTIGPNQFAIESTGPGPNLRSEISGPADLEYTERLGDKERLFIIGGGHCSLALSELMSRLGFHISIFDDRPELNTIEKNRFAGEISIIDSYEQVCSHIVPGDSSYVVVMTVGYASDEKVIRSLADLDLKYLGVLGSRAKMATLLRKLKEDGFPNDHLDRIHTPIGLPINSHTPDEIAVSIAAEIISVRNASVLNKTDPYPEVGIG